MSKPLCWKVGERALPLGGCSLFMGILNVTPDSFSDGGLHSDCETAVSRGEFLFAQGAAVVDIGGESTRPGYDPITAEEEIARVVPVIRELCRRLPDCILSIDTSKGLVAEAALAAGLLS